MKHTNGNVGHDVYLKSVRELTDDQPYYTFQNAMLVAEPVRLIGTAFTSGLDTNFWTSYAQNGGSVIVSTGIMILKTSVLSNASCSIKTMRRARFMFACPNKFRGAYRITDSGVTGNKRTWGICDDTYGLYFALDGTTFKLGYKNASGETLVSSGSFNGIKKSFTLDANVHAYEIIYYVMKIEYYIDGYLLHTITPTTSKLLMSINLPICIANINSGNETDRQIECWDTTVVRYGKEHHSTKSVRISTNTTTVLKLSPGTLSRVLVGVKGGAGARVTLYDATSAAGTPIAVIDSEVNAGTWEFDTDFFTGLTCVTSSTAGAADILIIYE